MASKTWLEIGGTIACLTTRGKFLKRLNPKKFSYVKNDDFYTYPMCDLRHYAIATKVLKLQHLIPTDVKNKILFKLKQTSLLIEKILIANKNDNKDIEKKYEAELEDSLEQISRKVLSFSKSKKVPTNALKSIVKEYEMEQVNSKYLFHIDSIDFDVDKHLDDIAIEAIKSFTNKDGTIKTDHTLYIVGGTDTIEYYSIIIRNILRDRGLLEKNRLVFISSMKTFADDPMHVAKYFKTAFLINSNFSYGAFIISIRAYKKVYIYDITDHGIVKISSAKSHSFRGRKVYICSLEDFKPVPSFKDLNLKPKNTLKVNDYNFVQRKIAPPLIDGNSVEAIISYLQIILQSNYYDTVIIDGFPKKLNKKKLDYLLLLINDLSKHGIEVHWLNSYYFSKGKKIFLTNFKTKFSIVSNFLEEIIKAGAKFHDRRMITTLYADLLLSQNSREQYTQGLVENKEKNNIAIKYIPQNLDFFFENIMPHFKKIVIEGVAGQRISCKYNKYDSNKLYIGFKYFDKTESFNNIYYDSGSFSKAHLCNMPTRNFIKLLNSKD